MKVILSLASLLVSSSSPSSSSSSRLLTTFFPSCFVILSSTALSLSSLFATSFVQVLPVLSPTTTNIRTNNSFLHTIMGPPERKKQKRAVLSSKTGSNNDAQLLSSSSASSSSFIILLSPAKTLDLNCCANIAQNTPIPWTEPGHVDREKTQRICDRMQHYHGAEARPRDHFAKLLGGVSTTIATTSRDYWRKFDTNTKLPCGLMFQGPAYKGLDMVSLAMQSSSSLSSDVVEAIDNDDKDDTTRNTTRTTTLNYLQHHLRIVDPVWGWLRPMDVIPPYRLEMATKNFFPKNDTHNKLEKYWKPALQSVVLSSSSSNNLSTTAVIINLASDEYSSAVLPIVLPPSRSSSSSSSSTGTGTTTTVVTVKVVFRNKGRVIAVHAKRARGLFARFLANHRIESLPEFWTAVPKFTTEGYVYQPKESDSASSSMGTGTPTMTVVYDRMTVPSTTKAKTTTTKNKKTTKTGK